MIKEYVPKLLRVHNLEKVKLNQKDEKITSLFYWLIILTIYVFLFEFILPVNKVLPKPSLLIESVVSLQKDYDLLLNLVYTASGVYLSLFIGYWIVNLCSRIIISLYQNYFNLFKAFYHLKYFPVLGFITIFILWFPSAGVSEFLFSIVVVVVFLSSVLIYRLQKTKPEYIEPFLVSNNSIKKGVIERIIWKSAQPYLFHSLIKLHVYLWSISLVFEFVKGAFGIGNLFRTALDYQDLSGMFVLAVILLIIIYLGEFIIKLLFKKFIYWES